jgi:hypothetical protein
MYSTITNFVECLYLERTLCNAVTEVPEHNVRAGQVCLTQMNDAVTEFNPIMVLD